MVELSGESLQPLLTWRPGDPGPRPGFGGRGEDLRYMQGTVVAWDPDTAENVVRIRGTDHTNVPLIDLGIGQRSIQAGDQVAIMSWSPNGGTAAYFIMGRLVVPGTTAAARSADALSTMASDVTQQLLTSPAGQDLAAFVIGQRMRSADVFTPGTRNNTSYGNLTGGGTGPVVPDVPISEAGIAIVALTAQVQVQDNAGRSGYMSVEVSGASSVAANDGWAMIADIGGTTGGQNISPRTTAIHRFTGLNPGNHTFTGRYRTLTTGGNVTWLNRNVTVWAY